MSVEIVCNECGGVMEPVMGFIMEHAYPNVRRGPGGWSLREPGKFAYGYHVEPAHEAAHFMWWSCPECGSATSAMPIPQAWKEAIEEAAAHAS